MPNKYEFDAVRWCKTMGDHYATRTENDAMAKKFHDTADEIHRLRMADDLNRQGAEQMREENATLRARVARLEGVTRMLIGCIEDTKKYPDVHDDFVEELESARRALEEK